MRFIFVLAIVLLSTTVLATMLLNDNGQVSMQWNDWIIETSLSFLVAATVITFVTVYIVLQLTLALWHLPVFWRRRRQMRRYSKAETAMAKGMIALEYGDWHKAEKELIKSAKHSEAGLVHYLSAAKMAHNQKANARRDQYIQQAREHYSSEYLTIGLVEARLLLEQQPEVALAILQTLHEQHPKHTTVLAEYAGALKQLGYWHTLGLLLPELKKRRALEAPALQALEQQYWAGKLALCATLEDLDALWEKLNKKQQLNAEILSEYVEKRLAWGQEVGLQELLVRAIKKQWHDRLVYQFGRLRLGPAFERLKIAEKWLQKQPNLQQNPVTLLTLGRLACQSQLWAHGQSYLKQSLKLQPEVETFHALAQCYEAEGKDNQAALTYKAAILELENRQKPPLS